MGVRSKYFLRGPPVMTVGGHSSFTGYCGPLGDLGAVIPADPSPQSHDTLLSASHFTLWQLLASHQPQFHLLSIANTLGSMTQARCTFRICTSQT